MKEKWKKILFGDRWDKEFTPILFLSLCSIFLGIALFLLEELKNVMIIISQVNPKEIIYYAPVIGLKMNGMVLWDIALVTILLAYLLGLTAVFWYAKMRMGKQRREKARDNLSPYFFSLIRKLQAIQQKKAIQEKRPKAFGNVKMSQDKMVVLVKASLLRTRRRQSKIIKYIFSAYEVQI